MPPTLHGVPTPPTRLPVPAPRFQARLVPSDGGEQLTLTGPSVASLERQAAELDPSATLASIVELWGAETGSAA